MCVDFVCSAVRERHLHSKRNSLFYLRHSKRICIGLSIHLLDPLLIRVAAAPLPSGAMELAETADETQSESQTGDLFDYYYSYSWSQPALSFARRRYKSQCGNPGLLAAFASIPSAFKEIKENNNVVAVNASAVDSSVAALRWVARFFSIVGKEESLSPLPGHLRRRPTTKK